MDDPTCSTCPFYDARSELCRAHPRQPARHYVMGPDGVDCLDDSHMLPEMKPTEWCGEHPMIAQRVANAMKLGAVEYLRPRSES